MSGKNGFTNVLGALSAAMGGVFFLGAVGLTIVRQVGVSGALESTLQPLLGKFPGSAALLSMSAHDALPLVGGSNWAVMVQDSMINYGLPVAVGAGVVGLVAVGLGITLARS